MGRRAKEKVATDPEVVDRIRRDLARWRPGLWAEELHYGPACVCGLRGSECHRHKEA